MTHVESIQKWRFDHVDIPLDMTLEEVAARIGWPRPRWRTAIPPRKVQIISRPLVRPLGIRS